MLKSLTNYKVLLLAVGFIISGSIASAASWNWTGVAGDGDWDTSGNWDPGTKPDVDGQPNIATIDGASVTVGRLGLTGGGTVNLLNGSSLTVGAGGLFMGWGPGPNPGNVTVNNSTLTTATAFDVAYGSKLNITNGGTVLVGGALNIAGSDSQVLISTGGTLTVSGNFVLNSADALLMSGGNLVITNGEFKPVGGNFDLGPGSSLTVGLISFEGTTNLVNLDGGSVTLSSTAFNGIFGGGGINFSSTNGGVLNVANLTGLIEDGKVYLDGVKLDLASINADLNFIINGNTLSYTAMIPEPSTIALLVIGGLMLAGTVYHKRQALKK